MGLITKISFSGQDKSGRTLKIKNTTGLKINGNPNGYDNDIISNINYFIITISTMFDGKVYSYKLDGTNPYLPSIDSFARGIELTLTTNLFETGDSLDSTDMFTDGVLDINCYTVFGPTNNVVIEKNNDYVYKIDETSFTHELEANSLVVNEKVYQVDKNAFGNGNTLIYITSKFEEMAYSFNPAYRANTKAFLVSVSENLHAHVVASLKDRHESDVWHNVNVSMAFRRAALGFFRAEPPDYSQADDLIKNGLKLLNKKV